MNEFRGERQQVILAERRIHEKDGTFVEPALDSNGPSVEFEGIHRQCSDKHIMFNIWGRDCDYIPLSDMGKDRLIYHLAKQAGLFIPWKL
jgi:hypothetical protein